MRALQQCEDLEDAESLRALHGIVRGAIMLNDASLLELLLAEDNVMDTVRVRAHVHVCADACRRTLEQVFSMHAMHGGGRPCARASCVEFRGGSGGKPGERTRSQWEHAMGC